MIGVSTARTARPTTAHKEPVAAATPLFEHGVPRGDLPRFWNLPVQAGCPLTVRVGLSGRGQLYAYGPEGHQIAAESGAHCLSLSFIPEDSGVHFLVLTNESGRPCSYSILAG